MRSVTLPSAVVSPRLNAEALLAVREDVVRAAERARQRAAHPDLVLAHRVLVVEGVEGDDALDVRRSETSSRCETNAMASSLT